MELSLLHARSVSSIILPRARQSESSCASKPIISNSCWLLCSSSRRMRERKEKIKQSDSKKKRTVQRKRHSELVSKKLPTLMPKRKQKKNPWTKCRVLYVCSSSHGPRKLVYKPPHAHGFPLPPPFSISISTHPNFSRQSPHLPQQEKWVF